MTKEYIAPQSAVVDFVEVKMIATSVPLSNEEVGEEFSQRKEGDFWGNDDNWED